jgi:hypothetical protein
VAVVPAVAAAVAVEKAVRGGHAVIIIHENKAKIQKEADEEGNVPWETSPTLSCRSVWILFSSFFFPSRAPLNNRLSPNGAKRLSCLTDFDEP